MGDCLNSSICSNVQISPSKFPIWNKFGGDLEGPPLILCRNCFSSKLFHLPFSANIWIFWQKDMVHFALRTSISHKCPGKYDVAWWTASNVWKCMWYIWIFGRRGSTNKIWTKTAYPDMSFFPNLDKKSQASRFGRNLAAIWNIQISGYLNIWTDKWITAVTHYCLNIPFQISDLEQIWRQFGRASRNFVP